MKVHPLLYPIWIALSLLWVIAVIWFEFYLETEVDRRLQPKAIAGGLADVHFWILIVIAPPFALILFYFVIRELIELVLRLYRMWLS